MVGGAGGGGGGNGNISFTFIKFMYDFSPWLSAKEIYPEWFISQGF